MFSAQLKHLPVRTLSDAGRRCGVPELSSVRPHPLFPIHNKNISAYDIAEVSFEVDSTIYVTDEAHLPADSKVVGNTWLNVNSDGSPDRRYKHNMPCLICEFGKVRISSDTGLDVLFLLSNADNVEQFKSILPQ